MTTANTTLSQLIQLSRNLGQPEKEYAILGEGNTSARSGDNTFWVKASGSELRTLDENGLVEVRIDRCNEIINGPDLNDEEIKQALEYVKVDPTAIRRPSVETFLHALALQLEGVNFVGHTHPTAVNAILCSVDVEHAISGRLYPDEIVVCGPAPVFVPYTDPGLPLARAVQKGIQKFQETWNLVPKYILMQNHGFIALGKSAQEVESIYAMYIKVARVLLGTFSLGGPHFMTPEQVARIHHREDEAYRRKVLGIL